MVRETELGLGRSFSVALAIFVLGGAVVIVTPGINAPVFHSILDTSAALLGGILALMLWDFGARTVDPVPRLLAVSFAIVSFFEVVHTVAALEALANVTIAGVPELRLRGATWGPPSLILPVGILGVLFLWRGEQPRPERFAAVLFATGVVLLVMMEVLPRRSETAWFGITRPVLIVGPLLWAVAGVLCWQQRHRSQILRIVALTSIIETLANVAMLYSPTFDDDAAMTAHIGKDSGLLFLLLGLMQIGAVEMVRRQLAEAALQQLNQRLEDRVHERTSALEQTNESLTAEIERREQAERKLQTQLDRLGLLDRITRAIGERQDMASIGQVVVHSLEEQLPVDLAFIAFYDPGAGDLVVRRVGAKARALTPPLEIVENSRLSLADSGLARCVKGELIYEPDLSEVKFPLPQRLADHGLKAMVVVPMMSEGRVFFVLGAARCQVASFSSADSEFLRLLGEHVALAGYQARLHETLQKAYDELRQTRQAVMQQERLRALGQMASGIAHDINNAMSPMALHTQMLLEDSGDASPRIRNYLEIVRRVTNDITATVARMREFYRERDSQTALVSVDLNQLAEQVIELTRARWSDMPQRNGIAIKLHKELGVGLPPAQGIESEIREGLTNLIFNAVDAMPRGGILTVRTSIAAAAPQTGADETPARVRLEIEDTGVGMDENTRRRCLEPFFTTKGERGTGLGLAMVYGMAQRLGAELEIDSELGKGTTFRLVFAVAPVAVDTARAPAKMQIPPLKILIIDDDPVILDSMRLVLEVDGHNVTPAHDGRSGLEAFRAAQVAGKPFAVVITDLGMPYMDGNQVAIVIKQISPATPVILLTGWGRRMSPEREMPPYIDQTLDKPPKLQELREALANTLPATAR